MFESLFDKVAGLEAYKFIKKKTARQMFSSKYGKIFKNSFFIEHLRWLPLTKMRPVREVFMILVIVL